MTIIMLIMMMMILIMMILIMMRMIMMTMISRFTTGSVDELDLDFMAQRLQTDEVRMMIVMMMIMMMMMTRRWRTSPGGETSRGRPCSTPS